MKKLLSVLLCAVMVLSLAACGKKENAPTPGPDPNGETEGLTVALVVAGKLGDRSASTTPPRRAWTAWSPTSA